MTARKTKATSVMGPASLRRWLGGRAGFLARRGRARVVSAAGEADGGPIRGGGATAKGLGPRGQHQRQFSTGGRRRCFLSRLAFSKCDTMVRKSHGDLGVQGWERRGWGGSVVDLAGRLQSLGRRSGPDLVRVLADIGVAEVALKIRSRVRRGCIVHVARRWLFWLGELDEVLRHRSILDGRRLSGRGPFE